MRMRSSRIFAVGASIALGAMVVPAMAATYGWSNGMAHKTGWSYESRALQRINSAETALSKGHSSAAMHDTGRAEITLLNAKENGDAKGSAALKSVEQARGDFVKHNVDGARVALSKAEKVLNGHTGSRKT